MPATKTPKAMKPEPKGAKFGTSIRLDPSQRDRLERLADAMTARLGGAEVPTSMAIRAALGRGIEVLEQEFGVASKTAKRGGR